VFNCNFLEISMKRKFLKKITILPKSRIYIFTYLFLHMWYLYFYISCRVFDIIYLVFLMISAFIITPRTLPIPISSSRARFKVLAKILKIQTIFQKNCETASPYPYFQCWIRFCRFLEQQVVQNVFFFCFFTTLK